MQTYRNFEVILIDDGSTDASPEICEAYAAKDSRIKIIRKKNEGAGNARNDGIALATGDYIMFLDSDDYWLTPNLVADIAGLLAESSADILHFGSKDVFESGKKPVYQKCGGKRECFVNKKPEEALENLNFVSGVVWDKVFKADFLKKNNIAFIKDFCTDTDWYFSAKAVIFAQSYDKYDYIAHAYRRRNFNIYASYITNNYSVLLCCIECLKAMEMLITDDLKKSPLLKFSMDIAAVLFCGAMSAFYNSFKKDTCKHPLLKAALPEIKRYSYFLKYANRSHFRIVYCFYKILGLKITMRLLETYYWLNRKRPTRRV
jgi:glycosyltransferase involved in cell wall biosynthesis